MTYKTQQDIVKFLNEKPITSFMKPGRFNHYKDLVSKLEFLGYNGNWNFIDEPDNFKEYLNTFGIEGLEYLSTCNLYFEKSCEDLLSEEDFLFLELVEKQGNKIIFESLI